MYFVRGNVEKLGSIRLTYYKIRGIWKEKKKCYKIWGIWKEKKKIKLKLIDV